MPAAPEHAAEKQAATERPECSRDLFIARDFDAHQETSMIPEPPSGWGRDHGGAKMPSFFERSHQHHCGHITSWGIGDRNVVPIDFAARRLEHKKRFRRLEGE